MNKARRATLSELHDRLTAIKQEIEAVRFEEEGALSNMPESLQDGSNGQAMQSAIDVLDEVESSLDSAIDELGKVAGVV